MRDSVIEPELLKQVEQVKTGDDGAFVAIHTQLEPQIRRFVRRLIGVSDAEDDIVQNVFIALYYNLHRIEPIEQFRPYLFRIARNCCYDELRDQGRYEAISLDAEEPHTASILANVADEAIPAPEELAHWVLLHLEVKAAMDHLPELQRQTLILYSEEGLTYAEIAVAMNTNIGTVKSRLFHAKRLLRNLLSPSTLKAIEDDLQID